MPSGWRKEDNSIMRQQQFEETYQVQWEQLEQLLVELDKPRRKRHMSTELMDQLPHLYRETCNHYALAQSRRYSPALESQLHDLVLRSHRQLYRHRSALFWRLVNFVTVDFPTSFRANINYFWLATALLLIPGLVVGGYIYKKPELIYSIMDDNQVAMYEHMYNPSNKKLGRSKERTAETDLYMFGFYIRNNIGVGFRTFASGMLLGLGTVLLLVFNGVSMGSVAGHLTRVGYNDTFWPFVSGHGAFELTAIVICGAAGLLLAHAIISPGQQTRIQALKSRANEAIKLVMGAALMLLIAAFIEAFWSSSGLSNAIKYSAAAIFWTLVIVYFLLVGRGSRGPR